MTQLFCEGTRDTRGGYQGGDSNPYGFLHQILSLARLPISPPWLKKSLFDRPAAGTKSVPSHRQTGEDSSRSADQGFSHGRWPRRRPFIEPNVESRCEATL